MNKKFFIIIILMQLGIMYSMFDFDKTRSIKRAVRNYRTTYREIHIKMNMDNVCSIEV